MRALDDLRRSRLAGTSEPRPGWLTGLSSDALVYRASGRRWPLLLLVGAVLVVVGVLMIGGGLSLVSGGAEPSEIVVIVVGVAFALFGAYVGRQALYVVRGGPTLAIDRNGVHVWRSGTTRWSEMRDFSITRADYTGELLNIARARRPSERTLLGRTPKTVIQQQLVDMPLLDLLVIMAQYSAAAHRGTPVEPPRSIEPGTTDTETPVLVTAEMIPPPEGWGGRMYTIGGTLDPRAGVGLHQLDLDGLLVERSTKVGYMLPAGPLGDATFAVLEALRGQPVVAPTRAQAVRGLIRRYAPAAVVVLAIVGGAVILRPYLTGSAGDLRVGDCFDMPPADTDVVTQVQHRPCTEPHDAEVVIVARHPAARGTTYPTDVRFDEFAEQRCVPAFETYTGLEWETALELTMTYYSPTRDGWDDGDREVTCLVHRADGAKLTMSVRAVPAGS